MASTNGVVNGEPEFPLHIETPLLKSSKLSERCGANVWLKLENVQNSGSFKARGLGHLAKKVGGSPVETALNKLDNYIYLPPGHSKWMYQICELFRSII